MGSAVGGRYLFSSNFEYANFVEKCCVGVVPLGVKLLVEVAILRRDDFHVFGIAFIRPKENLAQILFYSYTLKSCNTFLEVLFVAFLRRVFVQPPFVSLGKEQLKANFD